jgi:hypothetical protein
MHWLGWMQSAADWQGNAHLPYCVLQWCVPQGTSFWQAKASGPGVAMGAAAGAPGAPGWPGGIWPGAA